MLAIEAQTNNILDVEKKTLWIATTALPDGECTKKKSEILVAEIVKWLMKKSFLCN